MMRKLFATEPRWAPFLIRVGLGLVMLPHGLQKLGLIGDGNFQGTLDFFEQKLDIPVPLTILVIAAETLGAAGLIVGLLTRVAAAGIGCVLAGAVWLVHWNYGFFMDWNGKHNVEGYEFHLLGIAMAASLLLTGAGVLSFDRRIANPD